MSERGNISSGGGVLTGKGDEGISAGADGIGIAEKAPHLAAGQEKHVQA